MGINDHSIHSPLMFQNIYIYLYNYNPLKKDTEAYFQGQQHTNVQAIGNLESELNSTLPENLSAQQAKVVLLRMMLLFSI